jgi:glycine hydroxymethyltransferase
MLRRFASKITRKLPMPDLTLA